MLRIIAYIQNSNWIKLNVYNKSYILVLLKFNVQSSKFKVQRSNKALVSLLVIIPLSPSVPGAYETVGDDSTLSDDDVEEDYDDFDYEDPAAVRGGSGEPDKKEIVVCRCRVLYDFNSTQSSELTIREGEF